jgi:hypothetical protein
MGSVNTVARSLEPLQSSVNGPKLTMLGFASVDRSQPIATNAAVAEIRH